MSLYQRLIAKKMALFYRPRDGKGRFVCGRKHDLSIRVSPPQKEKEVREEAVRLLQEILKKIS